MATGDNGDKQPLVHKPGYHDDDEDSDHVISEDALRLRFLTTEELEANYWKMSAAFSVNHGCVNCCLAYASTVLGDRLGSIGNGLLYVVFALSAAFFSKPFVSWLGGKTSLVVSCFGYFIFVVGFLAAVLGKTTDDDTTAVEPIWGIYLIGCFCGGLSGGILWTAQGRYFAQSARLAASESGSAIEEKNNSFAATFALLYLGSEMVLKLIATLLYSISWGGVDSDIVVFGVYPVIAFISSVFMMLGTRDLQDNESMQTTVMGGCEQAVASFTLAFSDIRLALLLPFQVAFGFASSFFLYYIFGTIVSGSTKLGVSYIGLMSATIMFAGATTAFPAAYIANRYGKPVVMTGGGLALAAVGLTCFVFNTTILGTREMIIPIMIVFGVARGTWENTNRAVVADFFSHSPDKVTSAFAAVTFFNGLAAGLGYFSFYYMSRIGMAGLVTGTALVAVACYLIATHLPPATVIKDLSRPSSVRRMRSESGGSSHSSVVSATGSGSGSGGSDVMIGV